MIDALKLSRPIQNEAYLFDFSICTLVTRKEEYNEMLNSFIEKGFNSANCEFLYADNADQNNFDAFTAINLFLRKAQGKYIIICHQDIILHQDGINELNACLKTLDQTDPKWAICGNAGAVGPNYIVFHITYPPNTFSKKGQLPLKVNSLDENFLVIKNSALLKVSNDLSGFHFYGTDLTLQAQLNGFSAYVIPFNLMHKSKGNKNEEYYIIKKRLIKKYNQFFRARWIQTNTTEFYLSGSPFNWLVSNKFFLFFSKMANGLKKRLK
ncbi:hypothetical protein [Pedobacter flavus]|uniref:Acyl esterase n=1 Tax=Pedobacter flavus TaxID=3113906 RepID=A0ABU7GZ88_9SPHI|nr:hypothetical protein [Pedobacter sp. VNH31]MEE1884301.1 hypothetical protein [Pedobacter sp. VNH31]